MLIIQIATVYLLAGVYYAECQGITKWYQIVGCMVAFPMVWFIKKVDAYWTNFFRSYMPYTLDSTNRTK